MEDDIYIHKKTGKEFLATPIAAITPLHAAQGSLNRLIENSFTLKPINEPPTPELKVGDVVKVDYDSSTGWRSITKIEGDKIWIIDPSDGLSLWILLEDISYVRRNDVKIWEKKG